MKYYADTSFIVQLLLQDFATTEAKDALKELGKPPLLFLPLHELEVSNALRLRIFATSDAVSRVRAATRAETATGLRRLKFMLRIRQLLPVICDSNDIMAEATSLSELHTETTGARSLDTLHVAAAQLLNADLFLTCDRRQARLATRAGLKVKLIKEAL